MTAAEPDRTLREREGSNAGTGDKRRALACVLSLAERGV